MITKESALTILSKTSVLVLNFVIIIFTSQIWGSEGRGEIAIIMANISLITILNNIFTGSTVSYHVPKIKKNELLTIAFIGNIILSITGATLLGLYLNFDNFQHIFIISFLTSSLAIYISYCLGSKKIVWFNILNTVTPIFLIIYICVLYYIFKLTTLNTFFYAYYLALTSSLLIGKQVINYKKHIFNKNTIIAIVKYGYNNELSNFFQFLNYRLSYFFIAELLGFKTLGVFSVAVAVSESMWIISKSMSAMHYSNIINSNNDRLNLKLTSKLAIQNLCFVIGLSIILILLPNSLFTFVFGDSFVEVKKIVTYLIPGIISIAVSNLHGHYFAGIGKISILKHKSYIGFFATLISALILIPKYEVLGACITINLSHMASSFYLMYQFNKEKVLYFSNN